MRDGYGRGALNSLERALSPSPLPIECLSHFQQQQNPNKPKNSGSLQGANPHAEKCLRFVAAVAGSRPRLANSSTSNSPALAAARADALVERLLSLLAQASAAEDRGVRARSAGLLASCLNAQGEDAELSEALAVSLAEAAAARLADRAPPVRAAAVRVLGRLADPGPRGDFAEDPVTTAYLRLLRTERHRDVRRAVVACAPLCSRTLPALVERSRDVDDGVRRAVFVVLAEKVPMAALTIGARCALLGRGLRDRAPSVAAAARAMLVRWLDGPAAAGGCDGDVGALLGALDIDGGGGASIDDKGNNDGDNNESSSLPSSSSSSSAPHSTFTREAVAEAALRALDAEGRLHPVPLAHAAAETGSGLRRKVGKKPREGGGAAEAPEQEQQQDQQQAGPEEEENDDENALLASIPMSPEEALLWRVVAATLNERATARGRAAANSSGAVAAAHAAAASEALSALEAALPDTVEQLCDLARDAVAAANAAASLGDAEAARRHRFVARQLARVVASVGDLADEAGRAAAAGLLGFLLADAADATAQLSGSSRSGEGGDDEEEGGDDEEEDGEEDEEDAAARDWTDALAALARAAAATPAEVCPAALSAIALRLPGQQLAGSAAPAATEMEEDAAAAIAAAPAPLPPTGDAAAWRGCLGAATALLRCLLPNARVGGGGSSSREVVYGPRGSPLETLADLRPALVAPALCHSSPRVRAAAVEAAGLLSLASDDGGEVAALVAALRAAATADEAVVAARAVRALADATLVRGPRALVAEVEDEDEEEGDEEEEEVGAGAREEEAPQSSDAAAAASEASPGKKQRTTTGAPHKQPRSRQQPQPILALLSDAVSSLGSDDPRAVAGSEAAAEGLAKVLLHRGADDAAREVSDGAAVAALARLLATVVGEGDALAAPRARQALAIFFPMYAARGSRAAARLGAAALPAARAAAAADGKASSGADVLRYVAGVLGSVTAAQQAQRLRLQQQMQQQQARRFGGSVGNNNIHGHHNLPRYCPAAAALTSRAAVALFREARRVAPVAVAKPYAAAAVTLACALPLLLPASSTGLLLAAPSPLMPHHNGQAVAPLSPPPVPDAGRVAAAAEAAAGSLPASSGAAKVAQALARRLLSSAAAAAAVAAAAGENNNAAEQEEENDVAARLAATALGSQAAEEAADAETEGAGEVSAGAAASSEDDDEGAVIPRAPAASSSALAAGDEEEEEEEEGAFWSSLWEEAGASAMAAGGAAVLPFEAELAALGAGGGGAGIGRRSTAAAASDAAEDAAGGGAGATPLRRTRRAAAARATGRLRKVVADDISSGTSSSSESEEDSSSSDDNENESAGDTRNHHRNSAATASKIEDSSSDDDDGAGDDENTAPLVSNGNNGRLHSLSPAAPSLSASMGFFAANGGGEEEQELEHEESFGLSGDIARLSPAV